MGGTQILPEGDSGMPEGLKIWPRIVDLGVIGIILTINKKYMLSWNHQSLEVTFF
jgi:hypothetical protein